jgi:Molybdopterin-binding domain of aldehyde dehydrogenase
MVRCSPMSTPRPRSIPKSKRFSPIAGRPEATFVLERLVDIAAIEMGIDKADIRCRHMVPKAAYLYQLD